MNHRDSKEAVLIRTGLYSTTIYEMEIWTLANELDYTDEDYKEQLEHSGCMNCGLLRESVGLFSTKESALEHLDMMSEEPFDEYREIYCALQLHPEPKCPASIRRSRAMSASLPPLRIMQASSASCSASKC